MYQVGLGLKYDICDDVMSLKTKSNINPTAYILERSKCITSLLNGISAVKMDKTKDKDLFVFAHMVEQIYHMHF